MEPRTEAGIALGCTGNRQGSAKFYLLTSRRVVTRDQWTALPCPDSVIEHMNSLCTASKRGSTGVDPAFSRGATAVRDDPDDETTSLEMPEPPMVVPDPSVHVADPQPERAETLPLFDARAPVFDDTALTRATPTPNATPAVTKQVIAADEQIIGGRSVESNESETAVPVPQPIQPDPQAAPEPVAEESTTALPEDQDARLDSSPQPEPSESPEEQPAVERRYPARSSRTDWRSRASDRVASAYHIGVKQA